MGRRGKIGIACLCFTFWLAYLFPSSCFAQSTLTFRIRSEADRSILAGATVYLKPSGLGGVADSTGTATIPGVPNSEQEATISYLGFEPARLRIKLPRPSGAKPLEIELEPSGESLEEVIISTTRAGRSVRDIPTRLEVLDAEELDEKASMRPGDIQMLLNESTGINSQQTSAVSATANIRIQGLDGRYTQMLKDGLPLYQGFASGLAILQIPPLDLKQVEVIKGSASTLYGGGAIAGLVNLVSRTPGEGKPVLDALLNGTTARGADVAVFSSARRGKLGYTILGTYNHASAFDPSGQGFSAIPETRRVLLNPKVFFYPTTRTTVWAGINGTVESRYGGDMNRIRGGSPDGYFERNDTWRGSTQLVAQHRISDSLVLTAKNSVNVFDRRLQTPGQDFAGRQTSTFSELSFVAGPKRLEWVAGINLWTDQFAQRNPAPPLSGSGLGNTILTYGAFVQNTFRPNERLAFETGLRLDYVNSSFPVRSQGAVLPRASALYRLTDNLTARATAGFGYRSPSLYSEDAEGAGFAGLQPLGTTASLSLERSYGGGADVGYSTSFADGEGSLSINQLAFYTWLERPSQLLANATEPGLLYYANPEGYLRSRGLETNLNIRFEQLRFVAGYTYTDAIRQQNGVLLRQPLAAPHRGNAVLLYEKAGKFRIGLEVLLVSSQTRQNDMAGKAYYELGFLAEKRFGPLSVFVNCENLTDTRQTRFEQIYMGQKLAPSFRQIYAPLDGRIVNGGVKYRL